MKATTLSKWRPLSCVLSSQRALTENYSASAGSYAVHTPMEQISMSSVSHFSNWALPCTQIVGEMAQPLSKNMQFVWHAQPKQSKDTPVKYVFIGIYW
jgi:hypothetical protein